MKPIGGFFELELKSGCEFYPDAIALNSGRNSLEYILRAKDYNKIYLPFYICDSVLEPIKKLNTNFEFYKIDTNLKPIFSKELARNEVILIVNYFAIQGRLISELSSKFDNVIVDNTQAFFEKPITGVDTFYSPRKFFGVPDGGYLFTDKFLEMKFEEDKSVIRANHLLKRIEDGPENGYHCFLKNEKSFANQQTKKMSKFTRALLKSIDYVRVREIRNENFSFLHQALKYDNEFYPVIESANINGPMVYPFLKKGNDKLRKHLINNKVFVATYWPDVLEWLNHKDCYEIYLLNNLIPLPIDQRYSVNEMKEIVNIVKEV